MKERWISFSSGWRKREIARDKGPLTLETVCKDDKGGVWLSCCNLRNAFDRSNPREDLFLDKLGFETGSSDGGSKVPCALDSELDASVLGAITLNLNICA